MADIKISALLETNGTFKEGTKDAQAFNAETSKTKQLIKEVNQAQRGRFAASAAGRDEGYGTARGTVGTGAAGRDFAKQSQGLGGLVRLYATFAANIFAVGAAFQNLNQAAGFERMMIASDKMSTIVGTNLRQTAKNLQEVTGYAISFEDAMQFTNIGTSAGLAAKDIQNLVQIAKGAAAGLGRDVNDAVKRIVQGTAKQEQEILDELGIFVKAKKAYDDYAKKFDIKGGADALTAQQRVAAYATAVAEAGEKWKEFAEIDDPFARFVANGKEAIQTILSTINKVIVPIFDFINKSGDAITAIILAVSGMLVKRALPELKGVITELFTFDKARARSQADAARNEVLSQYNLTTKELVGLEKKRADLLLQATPSRELIAKAVGAEAAVRGKKGGVSVQQLGTAILGTEAKPLDISRIKEVEQVENKVLGTLRNQLRATKEKNELLDAFKAQQLVSNTATLESLTLGQRGKQIAKDNFDIITSHNAKRAQALALETSINEKTARRLELEKRINVLGILPEETDTGKKKPRRSSQQVGNLPPTGTAKTVAAAAAGMETAADAAKNVSLLTASMSTGEKITKGWTEGLAKSSEYMNDLNAAADRGWRQSISNFFNVVKTGTLNLGTLGTGLGLVGRSAAVAGGAISLLGSVAAGVFSLFSRALGPLTVLFLAWEMFGDKIIPTSWKETQVYSEKLVELNDVFGTTAQALSRVTKEQNATNYSFENYAKNIDTVSNALTSQINALNDLVAAQDNTQKVDELKAAREEAEKQGKAFSEVAYAVERLTKTPQLIELIDPEQLRLLEQSKQEIQDIENRRARYEKGREGWLFVWLRSQGYQTDQEKEFARETAAANERLRERTLVAQKNTEQARAENGIILSNRKSVEDALDSLRNKLKNVPKFGEIAKTEEARAFAKAFDDAMKPKQSIEQLKGSLENINTALVGLKQQGIEGATEGWEKFTEAMNSNNYQAALEFLKVSPELFGKLIEKVNQATDVYTAAAKASFLALQNIVNDSTYAIQQLDFSLSKTQAQNQRLAAVRGYATELEIATETQLQLNKANEEYTRSVTQAQLARSKVILKAGTGTPEAAEAEVAFKQALRTADLTREQAIFAAKNAGTQAKIQSELSKINKEYEGITRTNTLNNNIQNSLLQIEESRLQVLTDTDALSKTEAARIKARLDGVKIENTYQQGIKAAIDEKQKAEKEANAQNVAGSDALKQRLVEINSIYDNKIDLLKLDRDASREILDIVSEQKILYAQLADYEKEITHQQNLRQIAFDTQTEVLGIEKEILDVRREMGLISADQYSAETKRLRNLELERQAEQKKLKIQQDLETKLRDIETRAAAAEQAKYGGDPMAPWMQDTGFENEARKARESAAAQVASVDRVLSKNRELQRLLNTLSDDQKAYAEVFKGTFEGMADAMVEWAKTGKWAGKDLVDSLIADLARLYLRKQMMGLFEMGMQAVFGGTPTPSSGGGSGISAPKNFDIWPTALGAAYDTGGVKRFAKGGAFTNTIVNSPTLFKFAKGTGLMGEAGPEAIMPLKRDSNGNLGVRSSQQKTEVVVNNYSGQPAQTKETEDARGNRRVEVIVGDMTAGEVTRNGSSTNRAIRGTFGLQPQLIRR